MRTQSRRGLLDVRQSGYPQDLLRAARHDRNSLSAIESYLYSTIVIIPGKNTSTIIYLTIYGASSLCGREKYINVE